MKWAGSTSGFDEICMEVRETLTTHFGYLSSDLRVKLNIPHI